MKIELKHIEEYYYTNSMGEEKPLKELDKHHLLNAFRVAIKTQEFSDERNLEKEIIRRIS